MADRSAEGLFYFHGDDTLVNHKISSVIGPNGKGVAEVGDHCVVKYVDKGKSSTWLGILLYKTPTTGEKAHYEMELMMTQKHDMLRYTKDGRDQAIAKNLPIGKKTKKGIKQPAAKTQGTEPAVEAAPTPVTTIAVGAAVMGSPTAKDSHEGRIVALEFDRVSAKEHQDLIDKHEDLREEYAAETIATRKRFSEAIDDFTKRLKSLEDEISSLRQNQHDSAVFQVVKTRDDEIKACANRMIDEGFEEWTKVCNEALERYFTLQELATSSPSGGGKDPLPALEPLRAKKIRDILIAFCKMKPLPVPSKGLVSKTIGAKLQTSRKKVKKALEKASLSGTASPNSSFSSVSADSGHH